MRILAVLPLLAACSSNAPEPATQRLLYAGDGRDRLCIAGQRGGLIVYGDGNSNCSARGRIEQSADRFVLIPDGDSDCRIAANVNGDSIRIGTRPAVCAYYCGPGTDFAGKVLTKSNSASPAVDFAGDPLC